MTRRTAALDPVALVSRWDGFCLPCGSTERPLALTWTGRRGLRAWLAGDGWQDGELRLTCACCGGVDVVGWDDEPEPDVVPDVLVVSESVPEVVSEAVPEVVSEAPSEAVVEVAVPEVVVEPAPVVTVVRVVDLDARPAAVLTPAAVPVQPVPAQRGPEALQRRHERRAAERAARRAGAPAPRGTSDADALDVLHLVG